MKAFHRKLLIATVGIFAVAVQQCIALEAEYADDDLEDIIDFPTLRSLKSLTPEEETLANEARAHIAQTIEKNLIRLLVLAGRQNERQARQDEDDDDSVTPNPNVLPQVAQILGAIFSGSLNITRVVDQTFGLVPNIVRNQVGGLVKLLTGENMNGTAAATSAAAVSSTPKGAEAASGPSTPPAPVVVTPSPKTSPPKAKARTAPPPVEPTTNEAVVVEVEKATTTSSPPEPMVEDITQNLIKQQGNNTSRIKYRVRNRTRPSTTTRSLLEDDEIEKLEEDLRRYARSNEPYMRKQEPRFIADAFRRVFSRIDFNSTEIRSAVPTIFKGARQALVVLDTLGIVDANDLLDEIGIPTAEDDE